MTKNEYEDLRKLDWNPPPPLSGKDLNDQTDRTLLYGYTCDRESWHVYLRDGEIVVLIYMNESDPEILTVLSNHDYIPNKRLYPECCDYEFCNLLSKDRDVVLPFTVWMDLREEKQYYGYVLPIEQ